MGIQPQWLRIGGFRVLAAPARRASWAAVVFVLAAATAAGAEDAAVVERRLAEAAEYLASDELEGRGLATKGLAKAADFLADEFRKMGLKTELFDGQPFQRFTVTIGAKLGQTNTLELIGPGEDGKNRPLELGKDFNPLALGGSGEFDLPLVFAGYGITSKDPAYDDFADVDVQGKAVILLRKEPQQDNPHSEFNGTDITRHAFYSTKVSNAYQRGAAAVLFVTDAHEIRRNMQARRQQLDEAFKQLDQRRAAFAEIEQPTREQLETYLAELEPLVQQVETRTRALREALDPVLGFTDAQGDTDGRNLPVVHIRREMVDHILREEGTDLTTLEAEIDRDLKPRSKVLKWRVRGKISVEKTFAQIHNVVAVLEGEGPLAEETVVIGAHYDHLGYGERGAFNPHSGAVHNGADDNASGTAALLEVARQLAAQSKEKKLPRRVVFIAFTGEERGLLGSAHYVNAPLVPLDKTIAMLNMDMVGRLRDDKLVVHGTGTAKSFDTLVDELAGQHGLTLTKKPEGVGPSDHQSFYLKNIPALHFFTGSHPDYHRPSDDFDKLNIAGMRRVADLVRDAALAIIQAPQRPEFQETGSPRAFRGGGDRPYFGSIPDFTDDAEGYAIAGAAKDSPAAKAGFRGGDVIIKFGDNRIANLEDFDLALRKFKGGDTVEVVVRREGKEVTLKVTLDPPR